MSHRRRAAAALPALLLAAVLLGAELSPAAAAPCTGGGAAARLHLRRHSAPLPACTYADTTCAVGSICPGGTPVSAECADRSDFDENPCACTALQELAALSSDLQAEAPWSALPASPYCQTADDYSYSASLDVACELVNGVQLPTDLRLSEYSVLAGALPASLGELRSLTGMEVKRLDFGFPYGDAITSVPTELMVLTGLEYLSLTWTHIASVPAWIGALTGLTNLDLGGNAITSVPTEIGALTRLEYLDLSINQLTSVPSEIAALTSLTLLDLSLNVIASLPTEIAALTGLTKLYLYDNQLTGVPAEFRNVNPPNGCYLFNNPGFSCANVGAGTSCCNTAGNCPGGTSQCYWALSAPARRALRN